MGIIKKILCCFCPDPKDTYGVFFCCMPLALSAIFITLFIVWGAVWNIYSAAVSVLFPDFGTVSTMVISSIQLLFCVLGLIGIIFRIAALVGCLATGFEIILASFVISFVFTWIGWIIQLCDNPPWKPSTEEIIWMVIFNIMSIVFFITAYWIMGLFLSLAKVIKVGGTGWERKTADEVQDMKDAEDEESASQWDPKGDPSMSSAADARQSSLGSDDSV